MADINDFGSFGRETKKLLKDYLDARLEIYRLTAIRAFSRSAGYTLWIIISLMLFLLLFIFLGLVSGFWLSKITGSYIKGFGITTLGIGSLIALLALLRNQLFVNPIIRNIIQKSADNMEADITKK